MLSATTTSTNCLKTTFLKHQCIFLLPSTMFLSFNTTTHKVRTTKSTSWRQSCQWKHGMILSIHLLEIMSSGRTAAGWRDLQLLPYQSRLVYVEVKVEIMSSVTSLYSREKSVGLALGAPSTSKKVPIFLPLATFLGGSGLWCTEWWGLFELKRHFSRIKLLGRV